MNKEEHKRERNKDMQERDEKKRIHIELNTKETKQNKNAPLLHFMSTRQKKTNI